MYQSGGTAMRDTSFTYRGTGALHATTTVASGSALVHNDLALGSITSGDVYLRAYVYLPTGYAIDGMSIIQLCESQSPWDVVAIDIVADPGLPGEAVPQVWVAPTYVAVTAGAALPRDQWVCLRLHVQVDQSSGLVELWIGDQLVVSQGGLNTLAASPWGQLITGIAYTRSTQEPASIYVDEFAAGTAPLPCD